VTAPDNVILNGITRKHILEICAESQIKVEFECVNANRLNEFDAVFMTGTSPMVLPFCCIEDKFFNVKVPMIEMLRKLYLKKAEATFSLFRSE
jgi:branched-chain amino acid aminotransferase